LNLAWLKWFGTITGVAGALLLAINIPESGWGFVLFLGSSVSWCMAGITMKEPSIWTLHGVFTIVNMIGIYRWVI
jgi:drug/metabolite transporter (DMT)-like permease